MLSQIYNSKKYKSRPGYKAEAFELLDSQRNSVISSFEQEVTVRVAIEMSLLHILAMCQYTCHQLKLSRKMTILKYTWEVLRVIKNTCLFKEYLAEKCDVEN